VGVGNYDTPNGYHKRCGSLTLPAAVHTEGTHADIGLPVPEVLRIADLRLESGNLGRDGRDPLSC